MSNYIEALQEKIALLEDEKEELEDALTRVASKIEVLRELITEEAPDEVPSAPVKRKGGRPKGSKNKTTEVPPHDELYAEALKLGGTDPAKAAAIRNRGSLVGTSRETSYGAGVRVGNQASTGGRARPADHSSISIDESNENE